MAPDDFFPGQPPPNSAAGDLLPILPSTSDPRIPLHNLSLLLRRVDYLRHHLSSSLLSPSKLPRHYSQLASSEISSVLRLTISNAAALLQASHHLLPPLPQAAAAAPPSGAGKATDFVESKVSDCEIVEPDAVELLADHVHICDVCGKGFKRDANLRMHMRAHGEQFKTPAALSKPGAGVTAGGIRFSCPFPGCNRNRAHKKFRPLKSAVCVKNHFKRSHCPKMYACNRCHKKSFSVVADLKSHLKHCGECRWKCSCGTSFSRKDKLFGHLGLFEGHMPAGMGDLDKEKVKEVEVGEEGDDAGIDEEDSAGFGSLEALLDGFNAMEDDCSFEGLLDLQDEALRSDYVGKI